MAASRTRPLVKAPHRGLQRRRRLPTGAVHQPRHGVLKPHTRIIQVHGQLGDPGLQRQLLAPDCKHTPVTAPQPPQRGFPTGRGQRDELIPHSVQRRLVVGRQRPVQHDQRWTARAGVSRHLLQSQPQVNRCRIGFGQGAPAQGDVINEPRQFMGNTLDLLRIRGQYLNAADLTQSIFQSFQGARRRSPSGWPRNLIQVRPAIPVPKPVGALPHEQQSRTPPAPAQTPTGPGSSGPRFAQSSTPPPRWKPESRTPRIRGPCTVAHRYGATC